MFKFNPDYIKQRVYDIKTDADVEKYMNILKLMPTEPRIIEKPAAFEILVQNLISGPIPEVIVFMCYVKFIEILEEEVFCEKPKHITQMFDLEYAVATYLTERTRKMDGVPNTHGVPDETINKITEHVLNSIHGENDVTDEAKASARNQISLAYARREIICKYMHTLWSNPSFSGVDPFILAPNLRKKNGDTEETTLHIIRLLEIRVLKAISILNAAENWVQSLDTSITHESFESNVMKAYDNYFSKHVSTSILPCLAGRCAAHEFDQHKDINETYILHWKTMDDKKIKQDFGL